MKISKIKGIYIYFIFPCLASILMGQDTPNIVWDKTFRGESGGRGFSGQQTSDGGYVVTGYFNSEVSEHDVCLIKTDSAGDALWTKTYGGFNDDDGRSVQQTSDGGYIIVGRTYSYSAGDRDIFLIKTDALGDTLWTKIFGGSMDDGAYSVQQTSDGGYIIAGNTDSYGAGGGDVWLIKTDEGGDTLWTKTYGGSMGDGGDCVQQTSDGGYIIASGTDSYGAGGGDVWLIKTDEGGDTLWTKTYGGSMDDGSNYVQQTSDGGYILAGYTKSFGAGVEDVWLIKTDASGDTLWTKTYGGSGIDESECVQQTHDDGYIITGNTDSFGAGMEDLWLIKTDSAGDTIWTKTYGDFDDDAGRSIQQTSDLGYIVVGLTKTFGNDVWLIKIAPDTLKGDTLIVAVSPEKGYQTYRTDLVIKGLRTHFMDNQETLKIWLSHGTETILPDSINVLSNTILTGYFYIPEESSTGLWDVHVQTAPNTVLSKEQCFEILFSPALISVSPDTLNIFLETNATITSSITIQNNGESDLNFEILKEKESYALQFDGLDDQVFIGYNPILDIVGDLTICLWYKTETPRWGAMVCNYDQYDPDNGYELCSSSLYGYGGFVYFECAYYDNRDGFSTNTSFSDGKWHFVSAIYTPDGYSRGRVLVDGVEQTGNYLGTPVSSIGTTPEYAFKIGAAYSEAFFEGIIDEVRIWNRALSQQEIVTNMYHNLTGSEPGLIAYWNFNEAGGDSVFDMTANGNHGALQGGVTWIPDPVPIAPGWLSIEPDSGSCPVGSTFEITVQIDANELDPGEYSAFITVMCDDPFNPTVNIPIHVTVRPSTGIEQNLTSPLEFSLIQNYPNPFNPITKIKYTLPTQEIVKLEIFNTLGQRVETLLDKTMKAGNHEIEFNGHNLSSGIYFYRIEAGKFQDVKKLILIK